MLERGLERHSQSGLRVRLTQVRLDAAPMI
jgi:hypothetical protein